MTIQIKLLLRWGLWATGIVFFLHPGISIFFFSLKIHFVPYLAIKIAKVILTKGRTFFCGGRGQGGVNPS